MNNETKRGFATGMAVFESYDATVPTVDKPFGKALVELARKRDHSIPGRVDGDRRMRAWKRSESLVFPLHHDCK